MLKKWFVLRFGFTAQQFIYMQYTILPYVMLFNWIKAVNVFLFLSSLCVQYEPMGRIRNQSFFLPGTMGVQPSIKTTHSPCYSLFNSSLSCAAEPLFLIAIYSFFSLSLSSKVCLSVWETNEICCVEWLQRLHWGMRKQYDHSLVPVQQAQIHLLCHHIRLNLFWEF